MADHNAPHEAAPSTTPSMIAGGAELWNSSNLTSSLNWTTGMIMTTLASLVSTEATSASDREHQMSMTLFFILMVAGLCILVVHVLITTRFHILPESIAIIFVGALIGLLLRLVGNWREEEAFRPTIFFLVLLPPIIFESGYNLHKGNFFQNMGSILVFAIVGTIISAVIVGTGLYLCGVAKLAYQLTLLESFAFGSLISAVDPVATLAIFQALDVDPILYMLVFGESILNDAVSIVLMTSVLSLARPEMASLSGLSMFGHAVGNFCIAFLSSSALGILFGLMAALLLKWVDLRRTPSLEVGMMLIFSYAPYCLAEGLKLSGIMAILFAGIVMSHYAHHNLSPVTQITVQQVFRTIAFLAETCVFAYLGLAIFSFKHRIEPALIIWCIVLIMIGRAVNIFPLSFLVNYFREHKITGKNQVVMWFSGLRGAIAFALSLHMDIENEKREVIVTTTLVVVLFTILIFGGSTMPVMKFVNWCFRDRQPSASSSSYRRRTLRHRRRSGRGRRHSGDSESAVTLSKTHEMGNTVDSELTEEEILVAGREDGFPSSTADAESSWASHKGFLRVDLRYLVPFFTRRYTPSEVAEARSQMTSLTEQWYKEVRSATSEEEEAGPVAETSFNAGEGVVTSSRNGGSRVVLPRTNLNTGEDGDNVPLLS